MAFDFPNSPTNGQVFSPAGGPSYIYDSAGNKWTVTATSFTGQPLDALLTSIAALTFGADSYIYGTGSDTAAAGTVSSFMRTVLDDTTATAALTTLGITVGTYTPILANALNCPALTAGVCAYARIGSRVIVSGYLEADATLASTVSQFNMTLPIASDFVASTQCTGSASGVDIAQSIAIMSDATNNVAEFHFVSATTANMGLTFILMYQVI